MAGRLMPGSGEPPSGSGQQQQQPKSNASTASGVKKWATKLLQRGQTSIGLGNGSPADPSAATAAARSKSFHQSSSGQQPVLAQPSTLTANRARPVPPPRTSSCLSGQPSPRGGAASSLPTDFVRSPLVVEQQHQHQQHEIPVKSVRFGRQPSMPDAQQKPPDALAEATIGLEIAANLALAFARDVRRERLAAAVAGPTTHQSVAPPPAATPSIEFQLASNRQEVTLSEFYQLLQIVGQSRSTPSSSAAAVAAQPQQTSVSSSALVDGGQGAVAAAAGVTPGLNNDRLPQVQQQQTNKLPPGYLTARSFRQQSVPAATRAVQQTVPTADATVNRRQSSANIINSTGQPLKTRSLPRPSSSAGANLNSRNATPSCSRPTTPVPPPQVDKQCWAEILSLISQVLNVSAANHPETTTPTPGNGCTKRRPAAGSSGLAVATGGSLSDSEEAYHQRRRLAAAPASNRPYDTLQSQKSTSSSRPSSRAGQSQCGSHHSYLASLSQRLQIEQYIVKTLRHLGRSPSGALVAPDSPYSSESGPNGFVQSWGSPQHAAASANGSGSSNNNNNNSIGLERALLRLDQRRIERQPRQYQHNHWRITPAECNALFLCKVNTKTKKHKHTCLPDDALLPSQKKLSTFSF